MQLDATPASPTANAYVTVEAACEFLAGRRGAEAWFTVRMQTPFFMPMSSRQAQAIIWATQLLDEQINWFGHPLTITQALAFPMTGLVDQYGRWVDQETIPVAIQRATAFYALLLIPDEDDVPSMITPAQSRMAQRESSPRITYRDERVPVPAWQVIPAEIRHMLRFYGACTGSAVVPLRRA
jgi:hypothetical protein